MNTTALRPDALARLICRSSCSVMVAIRFLASGRLQRGERLCGKPRRECAGWLGGRLPRAYEAGLISEGYELCAVANAQLAERPADVCPGRRWCDHQSLRNLVVV